MSTLGLLAVFCVVFGVMWVTDVAPLPSSGPDHIPAIASAPAPTDPVVSIKDPKHPVYQFSVVPGGVRSAAEVTRVVFRDPVVAAHYANINVGVLRRERLTQPVRAHVSYRMGDKVYSTSRPLPIPAGEPVLTDGESFIRERCGNIISLAPLGPAAEPEPPLDQLDLVLAPVAPPAEATPQGRGTGGTGAPFPNAGIPPRGIPPTGLTPSSLTPVLLPSPSPTKTPPAETPTGKIVDPIGDPLDPTPTPTPTETPTPTPTPDSPVIVRPNETPVAVPEPTTFVLVGIGAVVGLARMARSRSRRAK